MSCARALSLKLGSLRRQVRLAGLFAVLEVADFPLLRVAGALFRVELARLVGVIAIGTTALLAATSVCGRR
jgi:hypothetical protein